MKKIDISALDIDDYADSIDIEKIKSTLKNLNPIKYKNIIDNIESIIKADIDTIKTSYLTLCDGFLDQEKKEIEKAFNYTAYRQKPVFFNNFKKLNIKSCPFCNNNYIYFYKENAGDEYNSLATLEHYYPKAKYPHLSLSFHNLIPCCSTCNSKFKGNESHEGEIAHPYYDDFNENADFRISVNDSIIKKDEDINISLKSMDPKCLKSIERFKLDKIYGEHRDIAKEIWNRAQVYNESRIEELYNSFYKDFGYTKEDVKDMIFCNYLHEDNINKRNHSKLSQDILKQFGLIKKKK
jgi:hypothetical protein